MSESQGMHGLGQLLRIKDGELEKLGRDLAHKRAVQARYQAAIARTDGLVQAAAPQGRVNPALLINGANYKQVVLGMLAMQRQDLALHEADMAVSQARLLAATQRRDALGQLHDSQLAAQRQAGERRAQRQQDEMASQAWWRAQ